MLPSFGGFRRNSLALDCSLLKEEVRGEMFAVEGVMVAGMTAETEVKWCQL